MDKRIIKTKASLQSTLLEMMRDEPFGKISVTDICKRAKTSRVTFYTYYGDKYDLLEDIFAQLEQETFEMVLALQEENNPGNDPRQGLINLMDAILKTSQPFFFPQKKDMANLEWIYSFYRYINRNLVRYQEEWGGYDTTKIPTELVNAFFIVGGFGALHVAMTKGYDKSEGVEKVHELIAQVIRSDLFDEE